MPICSASAWTVRRANSAALASPARIQPPRSQPEYLRLPPGPPDRCRGLAGEDPCQGGAPAAQRGRTTLMVIFRGETLPGNRRTARLSVRRGAAGTVTAGAALPACRWRGRGPAAAPVAGGLPPIGRGQAAAPESPSSPATPRSSRRPASRRLTNSRSAPRARPRNWRGPERSGAPAGRALENRRVSCHGRKTGQFRRCEQPLRRSLAALS
jgi:hypothetical protein